MKYRGFTVIEALTVVAIIGILSSLVTYGITQAARQGRDAKRKSDLNSIGLAFETRYQAKACNDSELGVYPGRNIALDGWKKVAELSGAKNECGNFSEYLTTIPEDVRGNRAPYVFNLSLSPSSAKHYRLGAKLERGVTNCNDDPQLTRDNQIWQTTYQGKNYCDADSAAVPALTEDYNYFVGN